jgi:hypothetical protein
MVMKDSAKITAADRDSVRFIGELPALGLIF